MDPNPRHSWLLVSPLEVAKNAEAIRSRPHVLIVDLVETVAESHRAQARDNARSAVERFSASAQVFGLVHRDTLKPDLDALVWPGLSGVLISRAQSTQDVQECGALLPDLEADRGLPPGAIQIVPSLDTALGNNQAMQIATATPRVWGLTLGRADLEMDLRPEPSGEFHLLPYLMQRLAIVAGAAGVTPLGAWWRPPARGLLAGVDDTYHAAVRGKAMGFQGAIVLADHQVEPVNRAYA